MEQDLERAARRIRAARRAVAFTGSGISAESGIPTYRGAGGLWKRFDPEKYASLEYFQRDPSYYWRFFQEIRRPAMQDARPAAGHLALARLEEQGRLAAVLTQNIDGLHQAAGSKNVVELHGTVRRASCTACGAPHTQEEFLPLLDREIPPRCAACRGVLRPDIVFFGEPLDPGNLDRAAAEARASDLMIVVGSSLAVYPAAGLPELAAWSGAGLIIINLDPTPLDARAEIVFHESAGEVLAAIVARL